jgi:integrase
MKELIDSYNVTDANFKAKAFKSINDYWAKLAPSKSKEDPMRIGSKSVFISRLKSALMEKAGSVVTGHKDFDELSPKEQLKFQLRSQKNGENKWVWSIDVIPKNIEDFGLPTDEVTTLKTMRAKVDNDKLRGESIEINGDQLLQKIMPLLNGTSLYRQLVPALLLATGRRSIEIMKTGDFYLEKDMDINGYECVFSGQSKQGLEISEPYVIPLLAPFKMVKTALNKVRTMFDATKMTTDEAHQKAAKSLNNWVKKLAGMTPHTLRSVYAMMCFQLKTTKMNLIGFIAKVLGHSQLQNAVYYQRISIINLSGPYVPTAEDKKEEKEEAPIVENKEEEKDDWNVKNVPESKRLETIKQLMFLKRKVTASAIRAYGGGTMAVISRVIANNQQKIDDYNKTV